MESREGGTMRRSVRPATGETCSLVMRSTLSILLVLITLASGCVSVEKSSEVTDSQADHPGELNVGLLMTGSSEGLRVHVDVAAECVPNGEALQGLKDLGDSVFSPAAVRVDEVTFVPRERWPTEWTVNEFRSLARERLESFDEEHAPDFYVLYVERESSQSGLGGKAVRWIVSRDGVLQSVPGMLVVCDVLSAATLPFVSRGSIERYVLRHEFGHALGLVENSSHEDPESPSHCTSNSCLMKGFWGHSAVQYLSLGLPWSKVPDSLCEQCEADVARAQALIRARTPEETRRIVERQSVVEMFWDLIESGDSDLALELLPRLRACAADDAGALTALGTALAMTGEPDEAELAFRSSLRFRTKSNERLAVATRLCALSQYRAASQAIADDRPFLSHGGVWVRAWALEGQGRISDALELLQAYLASRPPRGVVPEIHVERARLMRHAGHPELALEEFESLPGKREYWTADWLVELARTQIALGELEESRATLDLAADRFESQLSRNEIYYAEAAWGTAVAGLFRLEILALSGEQARVRDAYPDVLTAMSALPDYQALPLQLELAGVLAQSGDSRGALELCRKSLGAVAYISRARQDPSLSEAFASMREGGEINPTYPWCR